MEDIIKLLIAKAGRYTGHGINHEQQNFHGEFDLFPIVNSSGIEINFKASGEDGELYHQEKSLIARDQHQRYAMWGLNNNAPMLLQFEIREFSKEKIIFGFNDPNDLSLFREEIKLELLDSQKIGYHYSWGLPAAEFRYRSGLVMQQI